jgi:hypothetical protein
MGDRGNICMRYEDGNQVYFYSHWGGSHLPLVLQEALRYCGPEADSVRFEYDKPSRDNRWSDEAYLARVIFCHMVGGSEYDLMSTTGYGISPSICDNEHPVLVVDCKEKAVEFEVDEDDLSHGYHTEWPERRYTFSEFIELPESTFEEF